MTPDFCSRSLAEPNKIMNERIFSQSQENEKVKNGSEISAETLVSTSWLGADHSKAVGDREVRGVSRKAL